MIITLHNFILCAYAITWVAPALQQFERNSGNNTIFIVKLSALKSSYLVGKLQNNILIPYYYTFFGNNCKIKYHRRRLLLLSTISHFICSRRLTLANTQVEPTTDTLQPQKYKNRKPFVCTVSILNLKKLL